MTNKIKIVPNGDDVAEIESRFRDESPDVPRREVVRFRRLVSRKLGNAKWCNDFEIDPTHPNYIAVLDRAHYEMNIMGESQAR